MFVLFDTDHTAEIRKENIKDGKVVIGDKEYVLDKVRPRMLKTLFGWKPIYFLKWTTVYPADFETKEKPYGDKYTMKVLEPIEPKFLEEKQRIVPDILKSTADMRFLKSMKKYAGTGIDFGKILPAIALIMLLIIGGVLITYGAQMGWFGGV